jgi:hypothetical protein
VETVEAPVLLGHPAGVPAVDPFSDQIGVPAEALPLVLAGTEGLQVRVFRVAVLVVGRIQGHPVGAPVAVPLGVQRLVHREDPAEAAEVPQEDPAGAVVPLGN